MPFSTLRTGSPHNYYIGCAIAWDPDLTSDLHPSHRCPTRALSRRSKFGRVPRLTIKGADGIVKVSSLRPYSGSTIEPDECVIRI